MTKSQQSRWTRPILLITLTLPIGLFFFLYLGTEQQFEHVPYQYDLSGGDTVYHTLPTFSLQRTDGQHITQADLQDRIVLMSFFSVDDDADLKTTVLFGNLQRSYDNVDWEKNPPFLFVSVNTGDSLAAVQAFQDDMEADPDNWWLLHGEQESILRITQDGFQLPQFSGKEAGFTPFTDQTAVLIDKSGKARKYYFATDLQEERNIQEDLIALLRLDYPEEIERMRAQE